MQSNMIVFCHYYNEAYMLQWWLKHHYPLFDHGVMIDYGSTDNSNMLIRQLAPNWEIRRSRNPVFDIAACDQEVMEFEREFTGWKMVLNTTEFLCIQHKYAFLHQLNQQGQFIYRTTGVTMADPWGVYSDPSPDAPLVKQRFHGIYRYENIFRDRFIHQYPDGAYGPGRHQSFHPSESYIPGAYMLHFRFSPWNEEMIRRKLFIQTRIPQSDKDKGWGAQHFVDRPELERVYYETAAKAEDLRNRDDMRWIFL
ncbi:glycosyltransferase family 2 protein [Paenibacillus sp. NPDC056579]|uniref:glycosyltransferase family 2 protein n=1 Tax=Paenibacillus sp. NPDC056579 TaxID=3345871 RepID=UPI0036C66E9D